MPLVVVVVAVAVFLIGMHVWSWAAGRAYADGRLDAAGGDFRTQVSLTTHGPETWVANYNLGTTLLAQGEVDPGVEYLEVAMSGVPRATEVAPGRIESYSDECRVRMNLALGIEAQGDVRATAEDWSAAADLYQESSALLAPCQPSQQQPQSGQAQSGQQQPQSGEPQSGQQQPQSGEPQSGQQPQSGQDGDDADWSDPAQDAGSAKDRVDQKEQDARDRAEGRTPSTQQSPSPAPSGQGDASAEPSPEPTPGASGGQGSASPSPSPTQSDPFGDETEQQRQRREELERRLNQSQQQQDENYDRNRTGAPAGGW